MGASLSTTCFTSFKYSIQMEPNSTPSMLPVLVWQQTVKIMSTLRPAIRLKNSKFKNLKDNKKYNQFQRRKEHARRFIHSSIQMSNLRRAARTNSGRVDHEVQLLRRDGHHSAIVA